MEAYKTILVTGANGQLGKEFGALAASYPHYNFLLVSKQELAIENTAAVKQFFSGNKIDYCINCAAYTAVDKAETEQDAAFLINATAAGNLAAVCREYGALFIHFSTDYVFDGTANVPYKETDVVNPVSIYGKSKLQGEQLVLQNHSGAIIIRTSWVFSAFGNNFVKTMMRLMAERESINVVNDQLGCPTYAADLAEAVMKIISTQNKELPQSVVLNYCNQGVTTWYGFAMAIKEHIGSKCIISPITTAQYPTPAKRPQYSVLDTSLIKKRFGISIPLWQDSLKRCLLKLK